MGRIWLDGQWSILPRRVRNNSVSSKFVIFQFFQNYWIFQITPGLTIEVKQIHYSMLIISDYFDHYSYSSDCQNNYFFRPQIIRFFFDLKFELPTQFPTKWSTSRVCTRLPVQNWAYFDFAFYQKVLKPLFSESSRNSLSNALILTFFRGFLCRFKANYVFAQGYLMGWPPPWDQGGQCKWRRLLAVLA